MARADHRGAHSGMIKIRRPNMQDAASLAALGRNTFIDTFGHLYAPEDLHSFLAETYDAQSIAHHLADDSQYWQLAETKGQMIGYCALSLNMALPCPDAHDSAVELKKLYIDRAYHGTQAAHMLMQWAVERAENAGAHQIALSVYCDNIRAQNFYKKYDFAHVGDTEFHVGSHVDHEFIFLKSLNK